MVAHRLGISERTIEILRSRVMKKLGATSLPHLSACLSGRRRRVGRGGDRSLHRLRQVMGPRPLHLGTAPPRIRTIHSRGEDAQTRSPGQARRPHQALADNALRRSPSASQ
ncbi:MAG: LuxR C-terminal-related transcriptional regulator [Candidatus Eisenbacteria bacterium]